MFTFLFIGISFIGSKVILDEPAKQSGQHATQREIDRNLTLPTKTVFSPTKIDHLQSVSKEKTVEDIKATYKTKFEELQKSTNGKIDQLLEEAKKEFLSLENNKEKTSVVGFYQKYAAEGSAIEEETEQKFFSLYEQLTKELQQIGSSEEEAKEFKVIYTQQKEERKSDLLKRAIAIIKG